MHAEEQCLNNLAIRKKDEGLDMAIFVSILSQSPYPPPTRFTPLQISIIPMKLKCSSLEIAIEIRVYTAGI